MKNIKGITLIALSITIIVLIILAGVSVNLLLGENGLTKRANQSAIYAELSAIDDGIQVYRMVNDEETSSKDIYIKLSENEKLASKITVNDTGRDILVFKDLNEINVNVKNGKGYESIDFNTTESIQTITDLDDVYVIDLTDNTIYYVKDGETISISGSREIADSEIEKVEAALTDWKTIDNDDSTVTLIQYLGTDTEIVVPNWYNGKKVKAIKYENINTVEELLANMNTLIASGTAMYTYNSMVDIQAAINLNGNDIMLTLPINTTITKITISEGIEEIGAGVFIGLVNWSGNLVIPKSVTTIGDAAFLYNVSLTGNLNIPDNVKSLGYATFAYCSGFNGNMNLGNSLETIGENCFWSSNNFTGSLTIPDSVISIENAAFDSCKFNGKLVLGENLEKIGNNAFKNCSRFTGNLIIPSSVKSIGIDAFNNTGFSGRLIILEGIENIGRGAFNNTDFAGSLTIPKSVKTIGESAFQDCKELTEVNIGEGVTKIDKAAFYRCTGLITLSMGKQVMNIETGAFELCDKLSGQIVLSSTAVVADNAFDGTSITIKYE